MTTLDDFFTPKVDASLHPRVRTWKARLVRPGVTATVEVSGTSAAFGLPQPELHLQFHENGQPLSPETILWNDDLNAGLVRLGIRAVNPEQEAERFALALRGAMRQAEQEFGDGYLNSVLVDLLRDSDLVHDAQFSEVLNHTIAQQPNQASRRYPECREMIADAIGARAQELTGLLKYPQEEAKTILVAALARYLDERFAVSRRRQLGLL